MIKYGIYNAYWTREWSSDYKYYIEKVKKLGFDVLEISCAALQSDYIRDEQLLELKKHVKIMLDTYHMNIEEDNMGNAIRKAGDNLCHLHLGEQNRRVPGKGTLPWAEIGQALRDINYQGAAVMEPFVMSGGTIGSEIKVWRDLIPDATEEKLDKDAKGALQFVRHVFKI